MEVLLTFFVALTAIAVIAQLGILAALYVMSKRMAQQIDGFMKETREMMTPVKTITENLLTASGNLVEIGASAREQFRRVEAMVTDTGDVLHTQLERFDRVSQDLVDRINETATIVQDSVIKPVREVAAIAKGFGRGFDFFFRRQRSTVDQARQDEELFI